MEKLLAILKTALDRIRSNLLEKEADVKQAVVSPILRALDWDDSDPAECKCEHPVPGGSVDYALIRSSDKTLLVFIETKRLGGLSPQGENQLLEYAFKAGAPLLILTDGNIWDFYLSMMEGAPNDRRFYRAELKSEKNISECAQHFTDYLRKDRVVSGKARKIAERRQKIKNQKSKARNAISGVWRDLLAESDGLRGLLVVAVESKCGTKPELDDVKAFLAKQVASSPQTSPVATALSSLSSPRQKSAGSKPPRSSVNNQDQKTHLKIVGFVLFGKETPCGHGGNTLAEVLKAFQRRDPEFMPRFAVHRISVSRARRLVAQNQEALYKKSRHLLSKGESKKLEHGWWLGSNLSAGNIRRRIQIACEVAGVKFGSELTLIEQ